MKKIIAIIVLVGVLAAVYWMRKESSNEKIIAPAETPIVKQAEETTFQPDPSNATFTFDDGPISLSAGKNEKAVAPDSAITEETILLDKFAYGDLNADGKADTALLLTRYGGGSGTFIYAAAFVSGPVTYRGTDAIFVGDRIAPQSISINNGVVTVRYLDRKPDEAFTTEPTVSASKQFVYRNGKFAER